jgi:hypothetical protein
MPIAPDGHISAQTPHPAQRSVIVAFFSENAIAGQPNDRQTPQPVHRSGSTA